MPCNPQAQTQKRPMGIGKLGDKNLSIKRKFRWTLQINPYCSTPGTSSSGGAVAQSGGIGPNFVKTSARPNYDIEETELNFLNAKTWIAGKLTWQSITVTYIDCGAKDVSALYAWIGKNAQLNDNENFWQGTAFQDYAASATLTLFDGCGTAMEAWELYNVWPQAVNFGELDYGSSEEVTIELTLRYDQVCYQSFCPQVNFAPCCSPCTPV
jgi:hypothetical protein